MKNLRVRLAVRPQASVNDFELNGANLGAFLLCSAVRRAGTRNGLGLGSRSHRGESYVENRSISRNSPCVESDIDFRVWRQSAPAVTQGLLRPVEGERFHRRVRNGIKGELFPAVPKLRGKSKKRICLRRCSRNSRLIWYQLLRYGNRLPRNLWRSGSPLQKYL